MKNFWPVFAIILLFAVGALAQQPVPTPPEDNDVVKISTNLIQIDVSVTDKKGNVITDLKPGEIEIYENGKKQTITNFSFVSNVRSSTTKNSSVEKNNLPLPPPPTLKPENVHRTIALVVDDLTLSFGSVSATRDVLKKFVSEQMQEGDLVAIIRTGTGIGALQQFTNDKRQLLAAIQKIRFNMSGSAKVGLFNPIDEQINNARNKKGNTIGQQDQTRTDSDLEKEINDFRESIFARGTLGAINYIIRGIRGLPGRKSVVLISDGISVYIRNERGLPGPSNILDSMQRLTDLANRASVVIYTIDARGLVIGGMLSAEDNTAGINDEQLQKRLSSRNDELFDTQEGLRYLASQTGGFAYIDQNDMSIGLKRVLADQSYYLVGFEPDDESFDPKKHRFNKLEVKVKRGGAKVRYRSGFFGVSDEQVAGARAPVRQALYDALTSPFAVNEISLKLNALFMPDIKKASILRSFLHIDAKNLSFVRGADGNYKGSFDLVATIFGDNGIPEEGSRTSYTANLTEKEYENIQTDGLIYDFLFHIKKPGAYQLRIAIRDTETKRLGSAFQFVEVPNLKKNRLTLSGALLENLDYISWQKLDRMTPEAAVKLVNPLADTAIRQFRPGTVLTYSNTIYNAKPDHTGKSNLTIQARIFGDQTLVFEGKPTSIGQIPDAATKGIAASGSILLGAALPTGNYTLQLSVTDNNAKENRKVAIQFVPFEIVQ